LLQLSAGTAAVGTAPLKFTSGTNLTTAEAGALEYDGTTFYTTTAASSRGVSPSEYFIALSADYTCLNNSQPQNLLNSPANGAITLSGSTTYMFEGVFSLRATGFAAVDVSTLFAGTATITSIGYSVESAKAPNTSNQNDTRTSFINVPSAVIVTRNDADDYVTIIYKGIVRINGAGTFIPQFKYSAAPGGAPVVAANSYFKIYPVGSNTVTSVGNWN
jgi:hypothetical protein